MRASASPLVALVAGAVALAFAGVRAAPPAAQRPQLDERVYRELVKSLGPGKLLVAARGLPDPNFSRTVILIAAYADEGAMGVVINRRSEVTLGRVFPNLTPTSASANPAFIGGPVQRTEAVVALMRGADAPPNGRHIVDGVHLVGSRDALETVMASAPSPNRFRVFLGYSGWGPGQLEAETLQGSWHVLDATADVVFDEDFAGTWQRQIRRTEVIQARANAPAETPSRPGA